MADHCRAMADLYKARNAALTDEERRRKLMGTLASLDRNLSNVTYFEEVFGVTKR